MVEGAESTSVTLLNSALASFNRITAFEICHAIQTIRLASFSLLPADWAASNKDQVLQVDVVKIVQIAIICCYVSVLINGGLVGGTSFVCRVSGTFEGFFHATLPALTAREIRATTIRSRHAILSINFADCAGTFPGRCFEFHVLSSSNPTGGWRVSPVAFHMDSVELLANQSVATMLVVHDGSFGRQRVEGK